ncbi:ThiF family adenylyltransferase [Chloracidobacterium validum]|uniref:ThiF family adenylyltransferase n=1 Tax=Chloracidobacterium validum TaxID=2821543 RepID=A0ABX8B876_9BACT|nr:ThiF family adenylyltransferase [Chloracidobacterium validum]QUW03128.1 ThiF family adenylyltransferase [Chloracidobacterium validum]
MTERYSRQRLFAGIGADGQARLAGKSALVVGCGALGCTLAEMLVRAGVGQVRLVDRDFVEWSNLNRQVLFDETDARERRPKARAAEARLRAINSAITVEGIIADVTPDTVESLVVTADVVLDGTDNFETRYLLNDACVKHGKPWIYGAAVGSQGATMTILPGETPCLRCVFDEPPDAATTPTCETAGIILPVIQTIAAAQIVEALKLLTGQAALCRRDFWQVDVWTNRQARLPLPAERRRADCPCCGQRRFAFLTAERASFTAVLCGRQAVQVSPGRDRSAAPDFVALAARLVAIGDARHNADVLRFAADGLDATLFRDGRAIIKGTSSPDQARAFYAKYFGL